MNAKTRVIMSLVASVCVIYPSASFAEDQVIASETSAGSSREWSASVDIVRPGDDVFWDKGTGGTIKYTVMQTDTRGYAFSAGIQNWTVNEKIYSSGGNIGGGVVAAYASQLKGDASLVPLSALGVFRHELSPNLSLGLEAGLSYVIVNSKVKYDEALGVAAGGQGAIVGYESDVDIDNGFLAVFAADLRYKNNPSSKWTWFAGVGGQADLSKGDVTYPATPITGSAVAESELKALVVRIGLTGEI